jgi:short-subunit dehydrogenase
MGVHLATNVFCNVLPREGRAHRGGGTIIGSSSVNSDMPSPASASYAATKAASANLAASLAGILGVRGIPGEQCRTGADLDAADPRDDAEER